MNIQEIMELQKKHGCDDMQKLILSGDVWKFEGAYGRAAMAGLESGQFFLPDEPTFDYFGSRIPSRDELEPGTKGTLENSSQFWLNENELDDLARSGEGDRFEHLR